MKPYNRMDLESNLLGVDVDDVLRGQGADPGIIRQRRPGLAAVAAQAIEEGRALLEPEIVARAFSIESVVHETIMLEGGSVLRGPLVFQHFVAADQVTLVVCTIGNRLEARIEELFTAEPALSLALDGFGNAATEAAAIAACNQIEREAAARGLQVTIPINPGMIGWDLQPGQTQLFKALQPDPAIVRLNEGGQMIPRKSNSFAIGIGQHVERTGSGCEYCAMQHTCRYRSEDGR